MELAVNVAMIQCQNCGQANAPESQFCRFCGTKFLMSQPMPQQNYGYQEAPRPYSWKTDEYQTQADARRFPAGAQPAPQPLAARDAHFMSGNYRCPNCMSQFLPRIERRISTTGWIVFGVLLVVFFPLFWVGLLIKEDTQVCPSCNARLR
jgi:RNA polymerase subunit RPABC4/transcription elongation factor Spt4